MNPRTLETGLSRFTLAMLVIYAPVETWVSLPHPHGLLNPFYLVDLIAMILLFGGAVASLRARPRPSPSLLCGAYGWTGANGWRATFGRLEELGRGGELDYGTTELWAVIIGTALTLTCFAITLFLAVKASAGAERGRASDERV